MKFEKYQHIERLGTAETDGILNGTVSIFPKLDGTNGSVYLNDAGEIEVASRNRVLDVHNDSFGFCNYINNDERFKRFLTALPDCRLYGEWLVLHSISDYVDSAWRKFYVFDVIYRGRYIPYEEYEDVLDRYKIDYIPCLAELENPTEDEVREYATKCNFLMKEGCIGEGIVIKNYDFVNQFGNKVWAKVVNNKVKEYSRVMRPLPDTSIEFEIVDKFVTPHLVEKEFAKVVNENGGVFQSKLISKFLNYVWHALITEEMFNILRKFRNPKIDFALLNQMTTERVKNIKSDLFGR